MQDDGDCELLKLCPLLDELAAQPDVRPVLGRACRVQQLTAAWHRANAATFAAMTAPRSPPAAAVVAAVAAAAAAASAASPITSAQASPRRRSPQVASSGTRE